MEGDLDDGTEPGTIQLHVPDAGWPSDLVIREAANADLPAFTGMAEDSLTKGVELLTVGRQRAHAGHARLASVRLSFFSHWKWERSDARLLTAAVPRAVSLSGDLLFA
jgi:hypothetical protein